jgi:nucleoside-diphosphate-sugar epimerase
MSKTVLILGPTGRFGRNGAEAFAAAGWRLRKFNRKTDDLKQMATGVDVILNGWNPTYTEWAGQVPALTEQVIAAAKITDATVIIPGNVYVFGKNAPQNFSHTTPHAATNPLGRIRIEMEAAYRRAGVRTIILRAGDFLDTTDSGNWFDMIILKKLAKGVFTYPGTTDTPHAWAYLPDLLRAAVDLAEKRDTLDRFEDIPFPGYTLTGTELRAAVEAATGNDLKIKLMGWMPIRLISPFWKMGRHLVEMSYLWRKPHHLDGAKLKRLLPDFKPTPLPTAIATAVSFHVNPDQPVVGANVAA